MRLWSVPSGEAKDRFQQPSRIQGFAISPDGGVLAVAQTLADHFRLYDITEIDDDKQVVKLSDPLVRSGAIMATRFSPDGRLIATSSIDHTVRIWERTSGRLLDTLRGHEGEIGAIEFSTDSARLVSSGMDNTLRVWDLSDSARSILVKGGLLSNWSDVEFSPNGRLLVEISSGRPGGVWDVESGTALRRFDAKGDFIAISPDGKVVALGLQSGEVQLQAISNGEVLNTYHEHQAGICDIEFSRQGNYLASASPDGTLLIRKVSDGTIIHRESDYRGQAGTLEFFPGGSTLAWASKTLVKITDVKTGRVVAELPDHEQSVISLAISPDGKTLAAADWVGQISLWNLAGPKPQLKTVMRGSNKRVFSLTFSHDGRILVSGNKDGMVCFWEAATGESTGFLRIGDRAICSLACSPDGKSLAVASSDGSLRLWRVDSESNIEPAIIYHGVDSFKGAGSVRTGEGCGTGRVEATLSTILTRGD